MSFILMSKKRLEEKFVDVAGMSANTEQKLELMEIGLACQPKVEGDVNGFQK